MQPFHAIDDGRWAEGRIGKKRCASSYAMRSLLDAGAKVAFETAASLFYTRTGELVGSGPIQGSGSLGEITAKSYGVYDKGDRMVFKGGVHTRLDSQ